MKIEKLSFLNLQVFDKKVVILSAFFFFLLAHSLHAQDSKKIIKDSLNTENRISQFRDNFLAYMGQDLLDDSFPNSWPIFEDNARMAIGGYIKLDYIQDFNGVYDRFQFTLQNIPTTGEAKQSGYMNMFARESRFNIDFRGKTGSGAPFQIFFEFDFWNLERPALSQTIRLRHAYGIYDRLLAGRTWGIGTDLYAIPVTIDFEAGDAIAGTRRAQVRWEDKINNSMKYALGIEMLEYPGINAIGHAGQASQLLPLFAARITKETKNKGRLMLSSSVFQLRWNPENTSTNQTTLGWGVSFSGREYFGKKNHFMYWQGSYGDGWASNILSFLSYGSAVIRPNGTIKTMEAFTYGGGFVYNVSTVLSASVNTFWSKITDTKLLDTDRMTAGGTVHTNLIWSPVKNVNTGIEYMYGKRTNADGKSGEANRVQLMIKYLFP